VKKILFIHHGDLEGGAPLSMLYTMEAIKGNEFCFVVGIVIKKKKIHDFFNCKGYETIDMSWIKSMYLWSASDTFILRPHNLKSLIWFYSKQKLYSEKLKKIKEDYSIDFFHLNSVVLNPIAKTLLKLKIPFVWHVREAAPVKHRRFRFKLIQSLLQNSNKVIFLSNQEQYSWLENNNHGIVVNNFVDFKIFNAANVNICETKKNLNIKNDTFVMLYMGGIRSHKGFHVLIESLGILKNELGVDDFVCLMPDSLPIGEKIKISLKENVKVFIKKLFHSVESDYVLTQLNRIKALKIEENCLMMPFNPNTIELFATSDVLLFPAQVPHFARPIIEAGAMKKPVIASDLPVISELVENENTGLLVSATNATEWARAINNLCFSPEKRKLMGNNALIVAEKRFNADIQRNKIICLYNRL